MPTKNKDNSNKKAKGSNTKATLISQIMDMADRYPDSVEFKKDVTYGAEGKYQKQFKVTCQLSFLKQNLYWLIFASSSYSSDRERGPEFIAEQVKKILKSRGITTKAYYIVFHTHKKGKGDSHGSSYSTFRSRLEHGQLVTYFNDTMPLYQFLNMLQRKLTENMPQGKRSNARGRYSELVLTETFNNQLSVAKWNNRELHRQDNSQPDNFNLFCMVLRRLCPNVGIIKSAHAERCGDDHGKTDVIIKITDQKNKVYLLKVSVKTPDSQKSNSIAIHQGTAQQLADDLKKSIPAGSRFSNPDDFSKLASALLSFQKAGSEKQMKKEDPEGDKFLRANLHYLNKWLIDYFVFGINNTRLSNNQKANAFLVAYQKGSSPYINIGTIKDAENSLLNSVKPITDLDKVKKFGTPFSWTYEHSKKPNQGRGHNYKVKGPVKLFE